MSFVTLGKVIRASGFAAVLGFAAQGTLAASVTSIEIGGRQNAAISLSNCARNGVATTFTLSEDLYDAFFEFDILCVGGGCNGRILVVSADVTTGSPSVLSTVDANLYSVGQSFGGTAVTGFSGLDLTAGTYLVMMTGISGLATWLSSTAPVTSENLGSDGGSVTHIAPSPFVPTFTCYSALAAPVLQYRLTGDGGTDPSSVPLPAAGFLLLGVLGMM